jgi:peptidoglycan/LPS O-acetylase OafA/YrhL
MHSASKAQTKFKRIPELDGLRGIAILSVLCWHYLQVHTTPGSPAAYFWKLFSLSWAGVDLFFVLSGFLIGGILLENRSAPNYFSTFYVRRAFRIFPAYYLLLIIYGLLVLIDHRVPSPASDWLVSHPMPLLTYPLYLQNFAMAALGEHGANALGITWSLAIEEQFYLLLPLAIRFTPKRMLVPLMVLLVVLAPLTRFALYLWHPFKGFPGYVLLPARWDSLLCGVLAAYYIRHPQVEAWLRARQKQLTALTLGVFLSLFGFIAKGQSIGSAGMSLFGHTWLALFGVCLILMALFVESAPFRKLLKSRVLTWLGTISYGLYLYHQVANGLVHHLFTGHTPYIASWSDATATILALATTLGIAQLSWHYFESPCLRVGHAFQYNAKNYDSQPIRANEGADQTLSVL